MIIKITSIHRTRSKESDDMNFYENCYDFLYKNKFFLENFDIFAASDVIRTMK
jgi:hypothetical protein